MSVHRFFRRAPAFAGYRSATRESSTRRHAHTGNSSPLHSPLTEMWKNPENNLPAIPASASDPVLSRCILPCSQIQMPYYFLFLFAVFPSIPKLVYYTIFPWICPLFLSEIVPGFHPGFRLIACLPLSFLALFALSDTPFPLLLLFRYLFSFICLLHHDRLFLLCVMQPYHRLRPVQAHNYLFFLFRTCFSDLIQ